MSAWVTRTWPVVGRDTPHRCAVDLRRETIGSAAMTDVKQRGDREGEGPRVGWRQRAHVARQASRSGVAKSELEAEFECASAGVEPRDSHWRRVSRAGRVTDS